MKHSTAFIGVWLLFLLAAATAFGQVGGDFRSHASGNWTNDSTWEQYNGSAWVWPAPALPDTLHATTIRGGDTVTVLDSITVGNSLIAPGGELALSDTLHGIRITNGTMTVNGTLLETSGLAVSAPPRSVNIDSASGALVIGNGGTFQEDQDGGRIPHATWNDGSTLLITGIKAKTSIMGLPGQSYYNIVWNCPAQTANANMSMAPDTTHSTTWDTTSTIRGNLTVLNTGLARAYFTGPDAGTATHHNISRINVNGNITVLNGAILSSNGTSKGYTDIIVTVLGKIVVRDSGFVNSVWQFSQLAISRGSQSGLGTCTWYLKGDSISYGRKTTNQNSTDPNTAATSKGKFVFCKPGTQYLKLSDSVAWSGECNMQFGDSVVATTVIVGNSPINGSAATQRIKHNATVVVDTGGYIGGGTNTNTIPSNFAMDAGATLVLASQNGIRATGMGSSGAVRVSGTRDYGTAANFVYNGSAHQRLGSGFPASANNLTINDPSGVYVDSVAAFTVDGTLTVSSGHLDLNGCAITLGPSATLAETNGNTVSGSSGTIMTTRTLAAPSSSVDIAGLGVRIGSSASLGSTVITRGHAAQNAGATGQSITRYFTITPANNTGLNATMVFHYDGSEGNGQAKGLMGLYRSDDQVTWTPVPAISDAAANTLTASSIDHFSSWTAADTAAFSEQFNLSAGWNMVSVPLTVPDYHKTVLFPRASSPAFSYTGSYVVVPVLQNRIGYWVRFAAKDSAAMTGLVHSYDTFDCLAGWNLIGSLSAPVPVGSIVPVTAGLSTSSYFGYTGSYAKADTLLPGKGYWIKTNIDGKILLQSFGPAAKHSSGSQQWTKDFNSLTITDKNGYCQTLWFGADVSGAFPLAKYELPPLPPAGGFDARFATQHSVALYPAQSLVGKGCPISIQATAYPVTVSWNIVDADREFTLSDPSGGALAGRTTLTGRGSTTVNNADAGMLVLSIAAAGPLPAEFSLGANYPNPFNPSTSFQIALPRTARVEVAVYDMIGQRVRTLVSEELSAGYHTVEWNGLARDNTAAVSGVYLIRMVSENYSAVRKVVLMK